MNVVRELELIMISISARLERAALRVTGLIVDELGKALSTVLKLDGPADVLMSRFFRLNHKLGSRDRSIHLPRRSFTHCVTSQPLPGR